MLSDELVVRIDYSACVVDFVFSLVPILEHVEVGQEVLVHLFCFLLVRLIFFSEFVPVAVLDECETVELNRFSILVFRYLDARIDDFSLVLHHILFYMIWNIDRLPIVPYI